MRKSSCLSFASIAVLTGAFLATSAQAATTIVNWGGDYVSGTRDFANPIGEGTTSEASGYGGFSGGNPISLTPESGYSGGAIYGSVLELNGYSTSMTGLSGIVHNNTGDRIQLKSKDGTSEAAFLVLWNKADFLGEGSSTGSISFDSTSSIRLNIATYASQNTTDSGRLVIQSGGSYYVSERIFTATGDTTYSNLTDLDFFNYDPSSSLNVDHSSLGVVAASLIDEGVINGITRVGFYFESVFGNNAVRIQNFEVIATAAIPEPSTYAVFAGALCLTGAVVRRRRK